ncbi:DNA-binding transcriptional regulator, AcrR family [Paramicrobacterium humi]|uniref:DNA-binding transcriptional regulator, AcrR family n=1 Tax=Paramicrobacterium humi TaxID=640635 RepID=A0A1H4KMZ3_9MICO|nr:TetR/AcrR family transcriptional regulator [Microbacterium humi]SEB59753.1 DNA-binding transcriptional regulator, AcrR family [Microbacterium humi]
MATTARQRAREQLTAEILAAARSRLTREGPGQLSLRAVARDVGMVSSAVYRYFSSRDELLTALLIEAYNELGAAVEDAERSIAARDDIMARWFAACRAIRRWALDHPGDYALLYGSPVPGYAAPRETVGPASRTIVVLLDIVAAAGVGGEDRAAPPAPPGTPAGAENAVAGALAFAAERGLGDGSAAGTEIAMRLLMAWTNLFGTLSFELFGHSVGSVDDSEAYFDQVVYRLAWDMAIAP